MNKEVLLLRKQLNFSKWKRYKRRDEIITFPQHLKIRILYHAYDTIVTVIESNKIILFTESE